MADVNILVAEDDKDDYLLLKEAINEVLPKFDVYHAINGREVLNVLDEQPEPDIIFLDLNMPYINGIDCLISIRQQQRLQSVPVIIYSTSSHFEDIDNCYKNGCTLYLVKPSSYKDLVTQMKKIFFRIGLSKGKLQDLETFVVKKEEE